MAERLVAISKKQYDSFNSVTAALLAQQSTLETIASIILQGIDEDLGKVNVPGVRYVDGAHYLVVEVQ